MSIWAYCLMSNHVHFLVVGKWRWSISKALGNANRAYSRLKNKANGVTGHLWANRYFSTALDEPHLWAAVRYVELNPVRSDLVAKPIEYRWSSARANANLRVDGLLDPNRPFPGPIGDWAAWLRTGLDEPTRDRLRANTAIGQPTGSDRFVAEIAALLGRS
jgi:putative transposase